MAILKMKKLRLIAVRSNKEESLRELIRRGCLEITELEGELHGTDIEALVHRESSDVASLKSRHTTLTHAIDLLDHYAPKKGKLLSAKPELDDRVLLDDTGLAGALKVAEGIESYDARIKRISAEESRQRGVIQSLQPWLDLDLPLGTEGTERCAVLLGTIPARTEPGFDHVVVIMFENRSFDNAVLAVRTAEQGHSFFACYDDLDITMLLSSVTREASDRYQEKTVSALSEKEKKILSTYFAHDCHLNDTADALFLHKNTLQYQLDGIWHHTGYNPRNFRDAVVLYMGLLVADVKSGD